MLRVTRGAAVAAGKDLALTEQRVDHHLATLLDAGAEHVHRTGLGFDAIGKKLSDAVLHVHRETR